MKAGQFRRSLGFALAAPLALLFVTATAGAAPPVEATRHELTVFAAASLKESFAALAARFEQTNPGVHVTLNFAGSQELRTQLEHGASADAVALADQRHMQALATAGLVEPSRVFARNRLCIAVPKANTAGVHSLADLPKAERIVIGAPEVPVGTYTLQMLDKAGARYGGDFARRVEAKVVSRELNVRQVLAKVVLGEADAAVVYETDVVVGGDKVEAVHIPDDVNVIAEYPIAVVRAGREASLARRWIAFVLTEEGQAMLTRVGFQPVAPDPAEALMRAPPLSLKYRRLAHAPAALLGGLLGLPLVALVVTSTPTEIWRGLEHPLVLPALRISFITTTASLACVLLCGTPLAWWLARGGRGRGAVETLVQIPVVIPPAVAGVALLLAFGRLGLLAPVLPGLPFTTTAVVVAEVFVSAPFFVQAATAAFRRVDAETLIVARSLGASPWCVFSQIVVPLAAPGLAAGAAMCWARALGEFGATLMFAGNLTGRTQTLPLAIYTAMESDLAAAKALSIVLLVLAAGVLVVIRRGAWLQPLPARTP